MKPRRLRSPIKAIHEALSSVRLAVGGPLCAQPTQTDSFRDLLGSFNSVYYTPAVSSSDFSDSSSHGSLCRHPQQFPLDIRVASRAREEEDEDEEAVSVSAATASTSTCSSCLSSSSVTVGADNHDEPPEDLPKGAISSTRFFFSPCTSKFIAGEESLLEVGHAEDGPPGSPGLAQEPAAEAGEAEEGDWVFDASPDTILEEVATETTSALCRQSIPMALASRDPYSDFKSSMDEMVAAHGLRDRRGLQELLRCYLRLNEQKTHKFIVLAFTDLLVHLAAQGKIHKSVLHDTFCTSPLPPPHPPAPRLQPFLSSSTTTHCFPSSSSSSSSSSCSS